jgi:actin
VTGLSGDDQPKHITPSIIGFPKGSYTETGAFFGEEALNKNSLLRIIYPFQNAIVQDWNYFSMFLKYIFHQIYSESGYGLKIIINDFHRNIFIDRAKILQIMFQEFYASSLCVVNIAILSLHATNRYTGLVVHMEHGITTISPVYDGLVISKGVTRLELGRNYILEYLRKLLSLKGYDLYSKEGTKILNKIIDESCYVAYDYNEEIGKHLQEQEIALPEGGSFFLGSEIFSVLELLFKPSLHGYSFDGIQHQVVKSIAKCEKEIREILYQNIVLSGESSMFPGLQQRLEREIKLLYDKTKVVVEAPDQRNILPWIGGSKFESHKNYQEMLITSEDYSIRGKEFVINSKIENPQIE